MFLLISLINCTEYLYLYTIIKEDKTNSILFIHNSIKDDYEAYLELNDGQEKVFFKEGDRINLINDINEVVGHSGFNIDNYVCYDTGLIEYTFLNNVSLILSNASCLFSMAVEFINLTSASFTIYTDYRLKIEYLKKELESRSKTLKKIFTDAILSEGNFECRKIVIGLQYDIIKTDNEIEYGMRQITYNFMSCKHCREEVEALFINIANKIGDYDKKIEDYEKRINQFN